MNCSELRELIDLYIDGELPEEACGRVERHLFGCRECAFEARSLEQTRGFLREAFAPGEASPGFRERAAARLRYSLSDVLAKPEPAANQWSLPFLRETES